jgi:hypothetical protein
VWRRRLGGKTRAISFRPHLKKFHPNIFRAFLLLFHPPLRLPPPARASQDSRMI